MSRESVPELFRDLVDGAYDCVDRIVLRAYCRFIQAPAGFRLWWRLWQGSDEQLDNAHLIRLAGRFGRRVRAWAEKAGVAVIFSSAGERKDEISDAHLPADPTFRGVSLSPPVMAAPLVESGSVVMEAVRPGSLLTQSII